MRTLEELKELLKKYPGLHLSIEETELLIKNKILTQTWEGLIIDVDELNKI